ncbi:MAG: HDIG domain-containing protein [Anaerolineae bacterium]|jgi:putative nucleotidyltransferase with HDIG domain
MMKIELPEGPWRVVLDVAQARGVPIWIVGGAVRDHLLGRPVHDWDFAVDRDAMAIARAVGDALGGAFFPLDEQRGTARVVLGTEQNAPVELDFARLRGGSLSADLAMRDFTVNAMAVNEAGTLIDQLGGQRDLRDRQIRATSERAFRDDPARLLRAPRLEAELCLRIEPQTEAWIRRDAPLLPRPAAERVRDELVRGLAVSGASGFIQRLGDLGLLVHVLPEIESLKGVTQSYPHRFDVWRHTLIVTDALEVVVASIVGDSTRLGLYPALDVPPAAWGDLTRVIGQFAEEMRVHLSVAVSSGRDRRLLLKLGGLLHDIGKPQTRSVDEDGHIHFYNHEPVGARMAAARLRMLRFSRHEVQRMSTMVKGHLRPSHLTCAEGVTRRAIYRYFRDQGDAGVDVVLLGLADHLATWGPNLREERWMRRLEVAELLLHHYFERRAETVDPQLPVDGHDLMCELGLEPGPQIGLLLDTLREAMAAGEIETREDALALAALVSGLG